MAEPNGRDKNGANGSTQVIAPRAARTDIAHFVDNPDLPNIIELKHVHKTYDGGKTWTIQDLNLVVDAPPENGRFICILGKSGCGKSTMLRYIAHLDSPTSGEILINGKPRGPHTRVGMVFQRYSNFHWYSAVKNVALPLLYQGVPKNEAYDRAMAMLEAVGLAEHAHKYAGDFELSGGQQQRVAIARSLISNPKILLLDEPFGALDGVTRHDMRILLAKLWETMRCTIVFVTHEEKEAVFLGDEVWVMAPRPGRIVGRHLICLRYPRDFETMKKPYFMDKVAELQQQLLDTVQQAAREAAEEQKQPASGVVPQNEPVAMEAAPESAAVVSETASTPPT